MVINDKGYKPSNKLEETPPAPTPPPSWGGVPEPVVKPAISGFGEVSYGAKFEILGGSKNTVIAGTNNSVLLGMDNKMSFGAKTDISAGSELKISLGPEWSSPKTKWWPAKGFMAKYDFSTIKEHKLVISKDGSTDILIKKLTMANKHFQASAGYGLKGKIAYEAYTLIVSSMIKTIVFINTLLQVLNISNGLTVNPAANKQIGFDITNQARASWIPIAAQLFSTCAQLIAAVNVVLSRDVLKKAVLPNSVLQLTDGKGSFLGNRNASAAVLSGVELGETIKMGARKPTLAERLGIIFGNSFYEKDNDEFVSFKKPPESYFEASQNKAVVFSKALEIHANKDQKTKVDPNAGPSDSPKVLIKADGHPKAKIECLARKILLRTREKSEKGKVELVLDHERKEGKFSIDDKDIGLFMNSSEAALKTKDGDFSLDKNSVCLRKKGKGAIHVMNSYIILSHGSEMTVSKAGVKVNGNLVVLK